MNRRLLLALTLFFCTALVFSAEEGFSPSPDKEASVMVGNLHWLGHSSFRLDASKIIYFDPWKLPKNSKAADIILVTHEHFDHFSPNDIILVSSGNTVIVADKVVAAQLQKSKIAYKEIRALSPGESIDLAGVKVRGVPSYNINKSFHTQESKKLGFIVTVDNVTIYDAGDTDNIPEMKDLKCDIALLPVSGTYVMTADEAAQAALKIKPKVAIPMHYGDIVGASSDAERLRDLLKGKIKVEILNQGS